MYFVLILAHCWWEEWWMGDERGQLAQSGRTQKDRQTGIGYYSKRQ